MRIEKISLPVLSMILLLAGMSPAQVTFKKERGGYTATVSEKFEVSIGGDLRMDDLEGDITISGGKSGEVELIQEVYLEADDEAEAQKIFEELRAAIKKVGNSIEVTGPGGLGMHRAPRADRIYTTKQMLDVERKLAIIHRGADYSASYTVHVPENFNVDASTSGGDVNLSDLKGEARLRTAGGDVDVTNVTGPTDVKTSGGDVTARNLEGVIDLETSGGDVRLSDSRTGPFRLETAGGDITVQRLTGEVRAATSGGNVEARDVEGELDLRTSGGDITLTNVKGAYSRASTSGGDVEARTVVGNVDLRTSGGMVIATQVQGRVLGRTSGGDVEVSAITGETDISTSGGDLDMSGIQGALTGKTSGGNVRARVEKGGKLSGPIRLSTSGGEIELRLPADIQASVSARIRIQTNLLSSYGIGSDDYDIISDFKSITVNEEVLQKEGRGRLYEKIATGDLNGGGLLIELETVNGDINIERGN